MKVPHLSEPWRIFVLVTLLLGAVGILNQSEKPGKVWDSLGSRRSSLEKFGSEIIATEPRRFSADLELLLHGDKSQGTVEARWRPLHENNPECAMHFARYLQQASVIPADFRAKAQSLAPENGWFDIWEMADLLPKTITGLPEQDEEDQWQELIPRFKLDKPEEFQRALELFHQASAKSLYSDYFEEVFATLDAELETPQTYLEELEYRVSLAALSIQIKTWELLKDFIVVAVQNAIAQKDQKEFQRLEHSARRLTPLLFSTVHQSHTAVIFDGWLATFYSQMVRGSRYFNLREIESRYQELRDLVDERRSLMAKARGEPDYNETMWLYDRHGSMIASLVSVTGFSTNPKPVTKEELLPSCRAENSLLSRPFTVAWFVILIVGAIILWIQNLRMGQNQLAPLRKALAEMAQLTRWKVLSLGVILPFSLLIMIRYFTPLGQLDYAPTSSRLAHLTHPLMTSGLFVLSMVVFVVRRVTSSPQAKLPRGFVLPAIPLAAIFIMGFYHLSGREWWILKLANLLSMISFLWLAVIAIRQVVRNSEGHIIKRHLALPAVLLAAGLFGISTWALGQEEKYWIAKDETISPEGAFFSKQEARQFRQYRAELAQLLP